ncbi:MAG: hypothetical protein NVS2B7_31950 [Herpetosiphon sp.]
MNIFNRILVIVLDLLLVVGAVVVLLVTLGMLAPAQLLTSALSDTIVSQWLTSFMRMSPNATFLTIVSTVVSILVGLLLLGAELRPRRELQTITIRQDGLGSVTVGLASVRDLITYTAAQFTEVLQVQPQISTTERGLLIRCRTALMPEASIPDVSAALQAAIKQAVEQHLGMKVTQVVLQAQLEPLTGVANRTPRAPARRQLR